VAIQIRAGEAVDVDAAVSVFEASNLALRNYVWPERAARLDQVTAQLCNTSSWFFVATDGTAVVGMASAEFLHAQYGLGPHGPGGCFLALLFVVPERWSQGIGGALLDAVLAGAKAGGCSRVHLLTDKGNERAHRLYRSRGFTPTGRAAYEEDEWARTI
jgi:GNAT superfamily N-acetyltransferase